MKLPPAAHAIRKGRENELSMLKLLYEEGSATAKQLGLFSWGSSYDHKTGFHYRVINRLHKKSQVAWFRGPVRERLYYITPQGGARLKEAGSLRAPYYLGTTDYHSGRSGLTLQHDLGVVDCRLLLQNSDYKWISKSVLQASWQAQGSRHPVVPDALVGRLSDLSYWPEITPFSLEYERSSKSKTDRFLKIFRSQRLIADKVAGVLLVCKPTQVDLWSQSMQELEKNPSFSILTRKGNETLNISPSLLRFWTICTFKELPGAIARARAAYKADSMAPYPWSSYSPWTDWWENIWSPF